LASTGRTSDAGSANFVWLAAATAAIDLIKRRREKLHECGIDFLSRASRPWELLIGTKLPSARELLQQPLRRLVRR
jgi:hypothetical protein